MKPIQGLHHITAAARDTQQNVDFYEQVLGQRLVKTTVNFDDPGTYHLYYGDHVGTPGTVLTFFPWPNMVRGQRGTGEAAAVAYAIPVASVDYWAAHLEAQGVPVTETTTRFGEPVLRFADPDGMPLELVATDDPSTIEPWAEGPIPEAHALRGFHSVTLWLRDVGPTSDLLMEQLGYTFVAQEGERYRYQAASNDRALYLDLLHKPDQGPGRFGAGSVHHIAFRTVDDAEQAEYQEHLREAGHQVTPVRDRQYFRSIYFREPGGVLFEVATDAPGFAYDEPVETLGDRLKLPDWLEPRRPQIEQRLPVFERRT
ncbi:MAG: ring-cleaving dioxygenase [Bacteroidota bacterium]